MTDLEQEIADRFKRDTANHVMTVLHDDGLYRHLRCTKPGTSFYWFEIITWPGSLVFRGDMDSAPVFSRIDDMFAFFRSDRGRINPVYWSEKLSDCGRSVKKYSEDLLRARIDECIAEYEEEYPERKDRFAADRHRYDVAHWADRWPMKTGGPREPDELKTPAEIRQLIKDYDSDGMLGHWDGARDLLRELEQANVVSDTWEWDLTDWDWSFLWACHAIVWAIAQYDASRKPAKVGILRRLADEQAETRKWQEKHTALADEFTSEADRLQAEVDRIRAELDRRQAVADAAEQVIAAGQLSMDTPGVDVETIQHSAFNRLAEALEALNGEGTVQPLTAEPDSNVTVVYDRVGAVWNRDENGSWRMRGEGVPWRFHNLAREFGPITMRPAR